MDNKIIIKNIVQIKTKPSWYIVHCRVIYSRVKEIFDTIRIEAVVEYSG